MLVFAFALLLCGLTAYSLRGGLFAPAGMGVHSFDSTGVLLALAAIVAAIFFFGPVYGVAITFSVMIHEYGHVAAYRVAGHKDARFRMLPLVGGVAISNRTPDTQAEDFFITLMGPGICIAPMLLALVGAELTWGLYPEVAYSLAVFAAVTGALNFFNLLPFWPLDGGRCVKILAQTFWKPLGQVVAMGMSAALAATALWMGSLLLFFFAVLGAQSLFTGADVADRQRSMTRWQGLQALAAYTLVTVTHLGGGLWLILRAF